MANKPLADAAGKILIVLPENKEELQKAESVLRGVPVRERRDSLVGIPGEVELVRESVHEFACLDWIKHNTPELEGNQTARRESRARLAAAERRMEQAFDAILAPPHDRAGSCRWFWKGRDKELDSRRALHEHLSEICDALYSATPRIHNELVNRRELSSSAAAARRNLIEAMITRSAEPELGIVGTPPEKSMYLSVLATPGIHRKSPNGWRFGRPDTKAGPSIAAAWNAMLEFFRQSEREALTVAQLFQTLESLRRTASRQAQRQSYSVRPYLLRTRT